MQALHGGPDTKLVRGSLHNDAYRRLPRIRDHDACVRDARSSPPRLECTFLPPSSSSPSFQHLSFFPLPPETLTALTTHLASDEAKVKQIWFAFNGGHPSAERDAGKKPLHFDIAVNYVGVDVDALYRRAGVEAPPPSSATATAASESAAGEGGLGGKTRGEVGVTCGRLSMLRRS